MSEEIAAMLSDLAELKRLTSDVHTLRTIVEQRARALDAAHAKIAMLQTELDAARATLRDTIYRIEDVLEDAAIDDGIVHVAALTRLDDHYFTVLKPLRV